MRLKKSTTTMSGVCQMATVLSQGEKQPGRKFGPRPALPGHQRTLEPLSTAQREHNYRDQTGRRERPAPVFRLLPGWAKTYAVLQGLTPRQRRRSWHKELSAARRVADRSLASKDEALEEMAA